MELRWDATMCVWICFKFCLMVSTVVFSGTVNVVGVVVVVIEGSLFHVSWIRCLLCE